VKLPVVPRRVTAWIVVVVSAVTIGAGFYQSSASRNALARQQAALRGQEHKLALADVRLRAAQVKLRHLQLTHCQFDFDLGRAPVVTPAGVRPGKLGISIVSDSLVEWHELGCPGPAPVPSKTFRKWARYYHVPQG
jgi:hypothetical protein